MVIVSARMPEFGRGHWLDATSNCALLPPQAGRDLGGLARQLYGGLPFAQFDLLQAAIILMGQPVPGELLF